MNIDHLSSRLMDHLVPSRLYKPATALEAQELKSLEKIDIDIHATRGQALKSLALQVASAVSQCVASRGRCMICTSASAVDLELGAQLVQLVQQGKADFSHCVVFMREDVGLQGLVDPANTAASVASRFVFSQLSTDSSHVHPMPMAASLPDLEIACHDYERLIADHGGIDVALCQITDAGGVGFNQRGTTADSQCRPVLIDVPPVPLPLAAFADDAPSRYCATVGMSTLLAARHLFVVALGADCAQAVEEAVEGAVTADVPASLLQMHPSARLVADLEAASQLTRISRPWLLTRVNWTPHMASRAVTWLSKLLNKPVYRLSDQDFASHLLNDLVAVWGSAAATTTQVSTQLKYTLTNWPGGRPDADDPMSPERSAPHRKRVLIFSPHPDDAVLAMGGTISRLCQQGHDVHVVLCTSGDLAVGDADVWRMALLSERLNAHFGIAPGASSAMLASPQDMRHVKGRMAVSEAHNALRLLGVQSSHITELHLPFYTDSPVAYGPITQADVDPFVRIISDVEPHQIFAAADLADFMGTHRRVMALLLQAILQLKDHPLTSQCRLWLYRGLKNRWNISDVDMAVPLSPADFALKRRAVLSFQSQVRLTPGHTRTGRSMAWQQALKLSRLTAEAYAAAGLASYEAVESFVRFQPFAEND